MSDLNLVRASEEPAITIDASFTVTLCPGQVLTIQDGSGHVISRLTASIEELPDDEPSPPMSPHFEGEPTSFHTFDN